MEQHPVPQNVTTFQFRLIGDMTLRQFGYLAAGVVLAYVATKLPLPFFFTWPMALFFGLGGFGLAFVPVEERPMDIWIASFLRNTYSPTQYVWQKVKTKKPAAQPLVRSQAQPQQPPAAPTMPAAKPPTAFSSILSRLYGSKPSPPPTPSLSVSVQQATDPFGWIRSRLKQITIVQPHTTLANAFGSLNPPPARQKSEARPKVMPYPEPAKSQPSPPPQVTRPHLADAQVKQSETYQKQLADELARMHKEPPEAVSVAPQPTAIEPTVRAIGFEAAVAAGLPRLTTFPNVVTGIVKDDRGNLLSGALITVRDGAGVPLRALKTNKLGQFAASTPLSNGTYLVEIEDPQGRYVFDRAQIAIAGSVLPALEIRAKSQKQISREKLEKAIFGNQP